MTSYIDTPPIMERTGPNPGHSWRLFTYERLRWCHGEARARQIATGNDKPTNDDLKAWRNLGQRSAA